MTICSSGFIINGVQLLIIYMAGLLTSVVKAHGDSSVKATCAGSSSMDPTRTSHPGLPPSPPAPRSSPLISSPQRAACGFVEAPAHRRRSNAAAVAGGHRHRRACHHHSRRCFLGHLLLLSPAPQDVVDSACSAPRRSSRLHHCPPARPITSAARGGAVCVPPSDRKRSRVARFNIISFRGERRRDG